MAGSSGKSRSDRRLGFPPRVWHTGIAPLPALCLIPASDATRHAAPAKPPPMAFGNASASSDGKFNLS